MTANIQYYSPAEKLWEDYKELWKNAEVQSPFQSPDYLRTLANYFRGEIAIFSFFSNSRLTGAAFFRKKRGIYYFLSDIKADHNFFVIHKMSAEEEKRALIKSFFETIKKENWNLVLNNKPSWASYMDIFQEEMKASGLFWANSNHTVCKVLETPAPEDLYLRFGQSRELRYRMSRLINQQGAVFEVLTGEEDLEKWTEGFCQTHIKRWLNTVHPSKYEVPANRKILKDCLAAWIRDGVLARFSVLVDGARIAYVICLLQGKTLIHHSTAYEAEYSKYSPGKALMLFISQWMEKQDLTRLDFGEGGETYKDEFSNKELILQRIFISRQRNLPFILKAKLRNTMRRKMRTSPVLRKINRVRTLVFAHIAKLLTFLSYDIITMVEIEFIC